MKRNKVLVVGAMYSLNLGDAVICDTVKNMIEDQGHDAELLCITGADGFSKSVSAVEKRSFKSRLRVLKNKYPVNIAFISRRNRKLVRKLNAMDPGEYSMVIFAGGQLFMEYFVTYIHVIVHWAEKNHLPVVFNCCGMGQNPHGYYRQLLQKALLSPAVKAISLRDGVKAFEETYETAVSTKRILDPALDVSDYIDKDQTKKHCVGIGLIHPRDFRNDCVSITQDEYLVFLHNVIEVCRKRNIEFELFTNGEKRDQDFCEEFALSEGLQEKVAVRPEAARDLVSLIQHYDRIISFRLHSHIIATSYGIPTVAFIWDRKVKDFMESIHRREYCIPLDHMPTMSELEKKIDRLMDEDAELRFESELQHTSEYLQQCLEKYAVN